MKRLPYSMSTSDNHRVVDAAVRGLSERLGCRLLADPSKDREGWLAARRGIVTSTDVAHDHGGDWVKACVKRWHEKLDCSVPDTGYMLRGRLMEQGIIDDVRTAMVGVRYDGRLYGNGSFGASVDGFAWFEDLQWLVECKTCVDPGNSVKSAWIRQVHVGMLATGIPRAVLAVRVPGQDDLKLAAVELDDSVMQFVMRSIWQMWLCKPLALGIMDYSIDAVVSCLAGTGIADRSD